MSSHCVLTLVAGVTGAAGCLIGTSALFAAGKRVKTIRRVPLPGRGLCLEGYWPADWSDERCLDDFYGRAHQPSELNPEEPERWRPKLKLWYLLVAILAVAVWSFL